jgi:Domain of unknown function (DUF4397)
MSPLSKVMAVIVLPVLVACGDSDNNGFNFDGAQEKAELRVTHASADAPAVNVYVDGNAALEGVEFKQSSGLLELTDHRCIQ